MRSFWLVLGMIAFMQAGVVPAEAEKRVAFVIGNARYEKIDVLRNPKRDAALLADRLKDLGFEVTELFDADAFGMSRAVDTFLRNAQGADLALFYFAGHGIQLFDRNVLLARDVDPFAATTTAELGIDLTAFMDKLRRAGPIRQALLIDACRDNPLTFDATVSLMQRLQGANATSTAQLARTVKRSGLSSVALPQQKAGAETLVFFAAQPGNASYDGTGLNSYFAEGLKEGFADPTRPLMEIFRHVSAYVRTATNGAQVPQVVSDWTSDIALGAREAAKVTYNISRNDEKRPLTKAEEDLLIRTSSGYTRFKGDFIVRASSGVGENFDLYEAERKRSKELGSINGFSMAYDLDRDGRDEVIHVYFRQVNYVLVIEKDNVKTEVEGCFGNDEVTDVEVALRDINGDRRPEIWIAYDTGTNWSTFCILEFRGIPGLDSRRRGNTGLGNAGTQAFRTLLRGGAGWSVTVATDHSIKACAGSNCHSSASYTFDGEYFRLLSSELDDDIATIRGVPFRDERERAARLFAAWRQAAKPIAAGPFMTVAGAPQSVTAASQLALPGAEIGYACERPGQSEESDELFARTTKTSAAPEIEGNGRLSYPENRPVVPLLIDNAECVAQLVTTYEQTHRIYFSRETADRCIPLLAKARTVTLPLVQGERALLEVKLPPEAGRRAIIDAFNACRANGPRGQAGDRLANNSLPESAAPVAAEMKTRIMQFVTQYLDESGSFAPETISSNYAESVDYYKSRRSRKDIAVDKLRYTSRWPTRAYQLTSGTLAIEPNGSDNRSYRVSFEYSFRVSNGRETKEGRGIARLVLTSAGGVLRILTEDGEVLQRQ